MLSETAVGLYRRECKMCYYSLVADIESREAIAHEELVLAQLGDAVGFVSPREPDTAVCLCEGLQLQLSNLPLEITRKHNVGVVALATFFTHTSRRNERRDALYFGRSPDNALYLSDLPIGTTATVRSIPKSGFPVLADWRHPLEEKQVRAAA